MEATILINQAKELGLTLTVRDGMINAHGKRTPEVMSLLEQMKPMKAAIVETLTQPAVLESTLDPTTADLTDFVGAIVDNETLAILQQRCNALNWTLHTLPADAKWYVTGYHVQRCFGKIIAGAATNAGHYHYVIKPGTPLYFKAPDESAYKRWIWAKMQDSETGDAAVLAELYVIINGAWVGCDVYVDGPHASMVVAAAGYLFNQYNDTKPPLPRG